MNVVPRVSAYGRFDCTDKKDGAICLHYFIRAAYVADNWGRKGGKIGGKVEDQRWCSTPSSHPRPQALFHFLPLILSLIIVGGDRGQEPKIKGGGGATGGGRSGSRK